MPSSIQQDTGIFDIVIGNPPYGAKYPESLKGYFKENYQSAKSIKGQQKGSLDTFTLFTERGHSLIKIVGSLHYIVPLAITSSDSMTGLHKLLENSCSLIKIASFGMRPQPIFENADIRTSILFSQKDSKQNEKILTTKMYRKNKNFNLEYLINNLQFIDVRDIKLIGRYPKISLKIEREILKKIFSQKKNIGSLIKEKGKPIYYRTSGGGYYIVITNYSTGSTKEKPILFDKKISDIIGAILSSNLFFWFWIIYSNNLDLKFYEIESFGFPNIDDETINAIKKLYSEYLCDIERNAKVRQTTAHVNISSFKEYKLRKSKHLIDKIDDLICPLYGLTHEETDFIKNYEIEFRLDQDD